MATPAAESSHPLKHKTWVFKVSIHCEGCKKKVQKILLNLPGVETVNIETRQQKVTVTGNIDPYTLIYKLTKSGKHAELWPQISHSQSQHKQKIPIKEKQSHPPEETTEESTQNPTEKPKPIEESPKTVDDVKIPAKDAGDGEPAGAAAKVNDDGGDKISAEQQPIESKTPETVSAVNHSPATDNNGGEKDDGVEKSIGGSGGGGGKKKKSKGQDGNLRTQVESSSGAPESTGLLPNDSHGPPSISHLADHSRPRQHEYHYPAQYYAAPPPVHVNYNTAYPTTSYTSSYYATPPPYSHAYSYTGPVMEPPPSDVDSYPQQPLDSFELFSDENPNGCSIM